MITLPAVSALDLLLPRKKLTNTSVTALNGAVIGITLAWLTEICLITCCGAENPAIQGKDKDKDKHQHGLSADFTATSRTSDR